MTENLGAPGREIFRYSREDDVRIYSLHVVAGGTELWRVTIRPGHPNSSIKEDDFSSADMAVQYFEEVKRTLTAGGWREVSRVGL